MRVLLAQSAPFFPTFGGATKSNRLLLAALAERGHSCRAVAPCTAAGGSDDVSAEIEALRNYGAEISESAGTPDAFYFCYDHVNVRAVRDQRRLRAVVMAEIEAFQPDWILISSEDPGQVLLDAALACAPQRVIYLARTTLGLPFGPGAALCSETAAARLRRVHRIVTVSAYLRDYVREWGGIDAVVLPISLHCGAAHPVLGAFENPWITMVNPCRMKGIDILANLARALPQLSFAAVATWGTTSSDRECLRLPNVRWLDPSPDINDILRVSRVVLAPSLWAEAKARIILEAMSRGVPVIASDVGGNPEAKLGVDYLLPVNPITSYRPTLDERLLPEAVIPDQPMGPWVETVQTLATDRTVYDRLSAESWSAANGYLRDQTVEPFERLLASMDVPDSAPVEDRQHASARSGPHSDRSQKARLASALSRMRAAGSREDARL